MSDFDWDKPAKQDVTAKSDANAPSWDKPSKKTEDVKPERTFGTRVKDIAGTALESGVMGAFAPEILTGAGMAASAFPLVEPVKRLLVKLQKK